MTTAEENQNLLFQVENAGQAELGRQAITSAEKKMPGLMALCEKYRTSQPLKDARIAGIWYMSSEAAVMMETLVELGAKVQWVSSDDSPDCKALAAALTARGVPIYVWNLHLWQTERCLDLALTFPGGQQANLLVDDRTEFLIEHIHTKRSELLAGIMGVSVEDSTKKTLDRGPLKVPVFNFSYFDIEPTYTSIFRFIDRSCELLVKDVKRATVDGMLTDKLTVVVGYGQLGQSCAEILYASGCDVIVTEIDPIKARKAYLNGYEVATLEEAASRGVSIFVICTDSEGIIREEHFRTMLDSAVLYYVGYPRQIDVQWLEANAAEKVTIKCRVERYKLKTNDRHILLIDSGPLSKVVCFRRFVESHFFSRLVLALVELSKSPRKPPGTHWLPKKLEAEVAILHLPRLGAELNKRSDEPAANP